ncbi:MAG: hypothetical protein II385_02750, partial [Bacteroidaceae bacterium]|nr:hypothetical protein [Bacteroidaceae bacterium]
MVDKKAVLKAVDEWLEGKDYFLVDLSVSSDDRVVVVIDHADGVWIEDCADLSRYIESQMAAANMETGSDYLTDRVRCFVVTGEMDYLNDFIEDPEIGLDNESITPLMPVMLDMESDGGDFHALPVWTEPAFL